MPQKKQFTVATGAILKEHGTTKNFIEPKKALKKHTGTANEY